MEFEKPELIVHIGPPKTGTTSLQVALSGKLPPKMSFMGAYQPRDLNGKSRSHILNDWSKNPELESSERARSFIECIKANKINGVTTVVVEEVLLDSSQKMSWERKINNLARLNLPTKIVPAITLRNPWDGVISLHKEFSKNLGFLERKSVFLFSISHQCQVFNYLYLLKTLLISGFREVHVLSFDSMIQDGFDPSKLLGQDKEIFPILLGRENASSEVIRRNGLDEKILHLAISKWVDDYQVLMGVLSSSPRSSLFCITELIDLLKNK